MSEPIREPEILQWNGARQRILDAVAVIAAAKNLAAGARKWQWSGYEISDRYCAQECGCGWK